MRMMTEGGTRSEDFKVDGARESQETLADVGANPGYDCSSSGKDGDVDPASRIYLNKARSEG